MAGAHRQRRPAGRDVALAAAGIRERRGLRIALLSLAAAILLIGAATAGVFAYRTLGSGPSGWATPR